MTRHLIVLACIVVSPAALTTPPERVGGPSSAGDPTSLGVHTPDHDVANVFTGDGGLTQAGDDAVRWHGDAPLHGVDLPDIPHTRAFASDPSPTTRALAEAELTEVISALATGLPASPRVDPVMVDPATGWYASPDASWHGATPAPPTDALRQEVRHHATAGTLSGWLAARAPTIAQYTALVAAARRYRQLCQDGGWADVKPVRGRRGSRWRDTKELTRVQARLALEGFYVGEPTGRYDDAMRAAVVRYRKARIMRPKKYYDGDVADALNVPCEARLARILLNVRRWRHTAQRDEATYVRVNIAGASIEYVRDGARASVHRAVVGSDKPYWSRTHKAKFFRNATPVMHDTISKVVLNPTWTIPKRLVREDLEPAMKRDPDYLDKHHITVKSTANGHPLYVQSHGPHNALGQVKIMFPNSERIYLHDTPKQGFFRYTRRAFSHGCVRVKHAFDLAMALVDDDFKAQGHRFSVRRAKDVVKDNKKTTVYALQTPVPIFMEYYTASVQDDGTVAFHPDIYRYDEASYAQLAGR